MAAHKICHLDNNGLGVGTGGKEGHLSGHGDAVADDADGDGDGHGDHHPDGGNAAGKGQLLLLPDGHEAQEDVGHPEVAQAPGQGGDDAEPAEAGSGAGSGVIALGQAQVAGQSPGVLHDGVQAAGLADAEAHHHNERRRHKDALHQVGGGHGQKAAQHGVADDDHGADDHGGVVIKAEEAVEKGAHCLEAGGGIGNKEHQDHNGRDAGEGVALILVTAGKEVRHRDGPQAVGITADALGHDEPVEVGAHGQADAGPGDLRQAAEVGQARQAHEEVAAHVAGLRAHGGDHGTEAPAAEIEIVGTAAAAPAAEINADKQHRRKVNDDGDKDHDLGTLHGTLSFAMETV